MLKVKGDKTATKLEGAADAYYNTGVPVMTDTQYDELVVKLRKKNPDHPFLAKVGAPPGASHLTEAKHLMPMGSLNNANDAEDCRKWYKKHNTVVFITYKMDGSSIELIYEKGVFVQAITRGDGITGQDVTKNVLRIKNLPKKTKAVFSGSNHHGALLI